MNESVIGAATAAPGHAPRGGRGALAVLRPVASVVLAAAIIAITLVRDLQVDGWAWATLGALGVLTAVAVGVAGRRPSTDRLTAALSCLPVLAVLVWCIVSTVTDRGTAPFVAGAASALLVVGVHEIAHHAGTGGAHPPVPYVVAVVVVPALTAALWWWLDDPGSAVTSALAALIAAGPASLQVAAPAAFLAGARQRRRDGVTFDLAALDQLEAVDTIVLEQSGTVTTGELRVSSVDALDPDHERNLRWFAAALSHSSDDRIGRAVAKLAGRGRLTDVQHRPGVGVSGTVDQHPVRVGTPAWIGVEVPDGLWTTVAVEVDLRLLGTITVVEDVRENARADVDRLRGLGLEPVLVSDSSPDRARHIADEVGITDLRLVQDDTERSALIAQLHADGRQVAGVGAALGPVDVALTSVPDLPATIRLEDHDIRRLVRSLVLARSTLAGVRRGGRLALALSVVGLGLGAAGLIGPAGAAAFAVASVAAVALAAGRVRGA